MCILVDIYTHFSRTTAATGISGSEADSFLFYITSPASMRV